MAYTPELGRSFWFELDRRTAYNQAFMDVFGRSGAARSQRIYAQTRQQGTYPAAFVNAFRPAEQLWATLADVQTSTIRDVLGGDLGNLQRALEDFGQGTLWTPDDPDRAQDNNLIHMMDGQDNNPPVGYHRWHASIRLFQFLGIGDSDRWEELDRLVGLAWGIQSFARPRQQATPNAGIAEADLRQLRDVWLPLSPDRRDRQYDATPAAFGFHPSPKAPVA